MSMAFEIINKNNYTVGYMKYSFVINLSVANSLLLIKTSNRYYYD